MGEAGGIMRRLLSFVLVALGLFAAATTPALAEKRVALVIGNSAYRSVGPLANPANDATAMAALLKAAGFAVTELRDAGLTDFRRAVSDFSETASDADIVLFYFAGHGIEVDRANYLIPTDARLARDFDVADETVALDRVLQALEPARRLRLVILDACRTNPFVSSMRRSNRSVGRGLVRVDPATADTLVAFAAKENTVADDGAGSNSPFTAALLRHLTTPGLDIRIALGKVRDDVRSATQRKQEPFVYGSLGGQMVALVGAPATATPSVVTQPVPVDPDAAVRADYQAAERAGTKEAWDVFLARHPSGYYADLARVQRSKLAVVVPPVVPPLPPGSTTKPVVGVVPRIEPIPPGTTLAAVRTRGVLRCGVSQGLDGFSKPDSKGAWAGIDVDVCRAIAAAIFDDPSKVQFVPLTPKDRFGALTSGEIDVLARNTARTVEREALGLRFGAVNFYDGQGFMLRKALKIRSALELNDAAICVQSGTTLELNLQKYGQAKKLKFNVVGFSSTDEAVKAYDTQRCDALTNGISVLSADRLKMRKPEDHVTLPDYISDEQLAPAVRQGDEQWLAIVTWAHHAMVAAEELGVTRASVEAARQSSSPAIRSLLGAEGSHGEALGLTRDWAYRIIRHVGNYGEAFDRSLGSASRFNAPRGRNALQSKGGLQHAPPIQ
jgi:general L-amino acid transport system substrate-binding protein